MYIDQESDLEQKRFNKLKEKKIKKIFIKSTDEKKYQEFLDKLLNSDISSSGGKIEEKVDLVAGLAAEAINQMQQNPSSESSFEATMKAAGQIVKLNNLSPDALKGFFNLENEDDKLIENALQNCSLAQQIAKELGHKGYMLELIGAGALLCDISLPTLLPQSYQKYFTQQSDSIPTEEKEIFAQHPLKSAEMLGEKKYIPKEMLGMIMNHEENLTGSGFPRGIKKMSTEEQIISLACRVVHQFHTLGISQQEIMKNFIVDQIGTYDLNIIKTLNKIKLG